MQTCVRMELGAHIFIVTPETYEVHRDYWFCAVGKLPKDESGHIVPRVPVSMEEFETSPSQKHRLPARGFMDEMASVTYGLRVKKRRKEDCLDDATQPLTTGVNLQAQKLVGDLLRIWW